jgi:hypothetical protein
MIFEPPPIAEVEGATRADSVSRMASKAAPAAAQKSGAGIRPMVATLRQLTASRSQYRTQAPGSAPVTLRSIIHALRGVPNQV